MPPPPGPGAEGGGAAEPEQAWCAEVARMPPLAGQPLPPPRDVAVPWVQGQLFGADDDPDRTAEEWAAPPGFARGGAARPAAAQVEELAIGGIDGLARTSRSFARMVHGVLTPAECRALIDATNTKGYTPALINIGRGRQSYQPGYREGRRVIVDSPALAGWLMDRLRGAVPDLFADCAGDVRRLRGLNERCRFLCYTPGQYFAAHRDGHYVRPAGERHAGDGSEVTVQVYLNDVPAECGGQTTFLNGRRGAAEQRLAVQPRTGSVLVFTQDLYHEGSLLSEGLKYTMRTEAMYYETEEAEPPVAPTLLGTGPEAAA